MEISWTDRVKMKRYYLELRRTGTSYIRTIKRTKANWIDDNLCRNFLLKHVAKGNTEGGIEVTGRRGRRR